MNKMTIHRALSELKLIGARIEKQIEELLPSGTKSKNSLVNGMHEKEKFEAATKEKYQSTVDLIDRKDKIKSAIVKANALTKVFVAKQEMTIADAITLKTGIAFKKKLVEHLKKRHNANKAALAKSNDTVDANALQLASVALGKQNVKVNDADAQAAMATYLENNRFHMVDPLDVEKIISEQESYIASFEAEVDAVLSEVNAVTTIEF